MRHDSAYLRRLGRLLPVLVVTLGLFGGGLVAALAESLTENATTGRGGWTLAHYGSVLSDGEFLASLGVTLWVASSSTVISAAAGLAIALALRRLTAGRRIAYALVQVPLAVPHLAIALAFLTLLSPSGWFARVGHALGWFDTPADVPAVVYDRYGLGIILAYVAKEVPFLAVVSTAILLRLGPEFDRAAATLGATRWQRLRHVTLPLILPGLGSAALIVFAFVFAAFETPYLLGRPYPAMLSVVAQRRYMSLDLADRPAAVAFALLMTVLAAVLVRLYLSAARRASSRERPVVF